MAYVIVIVLVFIMFCWLYLDLDEFLPISIVKIPSLLESGKNHNQSDFEK